MPSKGLRKKLKILIMCTREIYEVAYFMALIIILILEKSKKKRKKARVRLYICLLFYFLPAKLSIFFSRKMSTFLPGCEIDHLRPALQASKIQKLYGF